MTTRFTYKPVLLLFVLFVCIWVLSIIGISVVNDFKVPPFGVFVFGFLFLFVFIWIVFGEFRRKIIRVALEGDHLNVSGYWGLGRRRSYRIEDFSEVYVSVLPTRFYQYEYLFLVRGQRREIILSEFYHRNYVEFKSAIQARVENLAKREYRLVDEFKVIIN